MKVPDLGFLRAPNNADPAVDKANQKINSPAAAGNPPRVTATLS